MPSPRLTTVRERRPRVATRSACWRGSQSTSYRTKTTAPQCRARAPTTSRRVRAIVAEGCHYYMSEGEAPGTTSCSDGIDNNHNGRADQGINVIGNADYDDVGGHAA